MISLGCAVEEVEDLRNEEEEQGLREVSDDRHHGKRHAGEVTERVSREHLHRS